MHESAEKQRRRRRRRRVTAWVVVIGLVAYGLYAVRARRAVEWEPPQGTLHREGLTVRLLGRSGSPILLLHGFMASNRYWGRAFDRLAADHRLLAPDLLGFGESPKPAAGYGPDDHADAIAATLRELGIEEPALVAAHSFGTLVALRLAVRHPRLVRAIVALGPSLYPDPETARRHLADIDPMGGLLTLESPLARRACIAFHEHPGFSSVVVRLLRPGLPAPIARDTASHTWASYWESIEKVLLPAEGEAWIRETRVPIRLVEGEDDRVVEPRFLRELAGRYPWVSLSIVPGGGHDLPLTHPSQCLEEIERAASRGAPASSVNALGTSRPGTRAGEAPRHQPGFS